MTIRIADLDKAKTFSIGAPPWRGNRAVEAIHAALDGQALLVGGVVRDAVLGVKGADIDMATPFPPDEVARRVEAAGLKAHPTGIEHGTVTVVREGKAVEVTTFRRDAATDGRRAVVAFTPSALHDAQRRDFTINAFYATPGGKVYDFFGGRADLAERRVRFIGSARERIAEDYLRILRFFRFSARFNAVPLDAEGLAASVAARAGLRTLSRERIRAEFLRILQCTDALPVIEAMFAHGFLDEMISAVPRLSRLGGLRARESALGEPHDAMRAIGALYLHSADHVGRLRSAFVLSRAEQRALADLVDPRAFPAVNIREAVFRFGPAAATSQAISAPGLDAEARRVAVHTARTWQAPSFPLKGADLLEAGFTPGPELGRKMENLETLWVRSGFKLTKKDLLKEL